MNYYERIQKSIDYMEENLEADIKVSDIAKKAFMSLSSYYPIFFSITGYQVKEYLINRRISCASRELMAGETKVIDIAMKYGYRSVDAFTRIFKKVTGHVPSSCAETQYEYKFIRINVMEKYFLASDEKTLTQYPDIKVLHDLPEMRVAYYCYYGRNPEHGAFLEMKRWVMKNKLKYQNGGYRIFGYDAPETDASAEEYGYEVCVTIPEDMKVVDDVVKTKMIAGGLYAVMSIEHKENLGEEIKASWNRFLQWMDGSKYKYGETQWLEEHLGFDSNFKHIGSIDLYMPIREKRA